MHLNLFLDCSAIWTVKLKWSEQTVSINGIESVQSVYFDKNITLGISNCWLDIRTSCQSREGDQWTSTQSCFWRCLKSHQRRWESLQVDNSAHELKRCLKLFSGYAHTDIAPIKLQRRHQSEQSRAADGEHQYTVRGRIIAESFIKEVMNWSHEVKKTTNNEDVQNGGL